MSLPTNIPYSTITSACLIVLVSSILGENVKGLCTDFQLAGVEKLLVLCARTHFFISCAFFGRCAGKNTVFAKWFYFFSVDLSMENSMDKSMETCNF